MSHPQLNPSARKVLPGVHSSPSGTNSADKTPPIASVSDSVLLERVAQGDAPAMAEIYDRYAQICLATAQRIVGDQELAVEVTEEILLHIWRQPTRFTACRCELAAWISLFTRNYAQEALRTRSRFVSSTEIQLPDPHELTLAGSQTWKQDRLKLVVANLPQEQQSLLELIWFKRLSNDEIARQTGLPTETIGLRIQSALKTLQRALELHD